MLRVLFLLVYKFLPFFMFIAYHFQQILFDDISPPQPIVNVNKISLP